MEAGRLDSWKQIAAYLGKSERTVRRWHELEGLPVHKHAHQQRGSVWAYQTELDAWLAGRTVRPEPLAVPVQASRPKRPHWIAAVMALAGLGVLVGTVRTPRTAVSGDTLPLTTLPGAETAASFDPDGKRFVFEWTGPNAGNPGLYIRDTQQGTIRPLATSPGPTNFQYSPAWSPDGKWIAYLKRTAKQETWLMLIRPDGTGELQLTNIAVPPTLFYANHQHVAWSPDARWLYAPFALSDGRRGIYRVSPEDGSASAIVDRVAVHAPAISPDGRKLIVVKPEGLPMASEELLVYPLTEAGEPAGEPKRIAKGSFASSGVAWLNDTAVLLCAAETSLIGPLGTHLYRIDIAPTPQRTRIEVAGAECQTVSVSRTGTIVFGDSSRVALSMRKTRLRSSGETQDFVASSRYDALPQFSPDGRWVAFYSTRSGRAEIWVARSDGTDARQVTNESGARSGPKWSPDGSKIVYVSDHSLVTRAIAGSERMEWEAKGEGLPQHPVWADDGTIFYTSGARLWRMRPDGTARQPVTELEPILSLSKSRDSNILLFTRVGSPVTLYQLNLKTGRQQLVKGGLGALSVAVTHRFLYYVGDDANLYAQPIAGGAPFPVTGVPRLGDPRKRQWDTALTVSPDDSELIWTTTPSQEIDLEVLNLR